MFHAPHHPGFASTTQMSDTMFNKADCAAEFRLIKHFL
ncbi:uncharacterized protein METZ01_LOCUS466936, partial [marine metagenome]